MISELNELRSKLDKLCENNSLTAEVSLTDFPIRFNFRDEDWQEKQETFFREPDVQPMATSIDLIFGDVLVVKTPEQSEIDDELLSKLKAIAKKIHYLYLQLFFKQVKDRERANAKAYEEKEDSES
jgi:hypothetical protein